LNDTQKNGEQGGGNQGDERSFKKEKRKEKRTLMRWGLRCREKWSGS